MWTDEQYQGTEIVRHVKKLYGLETVGITAAKALLILCRVFGGFHHLHINDKKRCAPSFWNDGLFRYTCGDTLSTFDWNKLALLDIFAHDHCVRIEIEPCNMRHIFIVFSNRKRKPDSWSEHHPTIGEAISTARALLSPENDDLPF